MAYKFKEFIYTNKFREVKLRSNQFKDIKVKTINLTL